MAVANNKSVSITNGDASPPAITSSYIDKGVLRESIGQLSFAAADDDGSVHRICRLPSNARISDVQILHAAVTGGTDFDFGLYATAADGGAVVDKDIIADGVDLSSARAVWTSIVGGTSAYLGANGASADDCEDRLWEIAAQTSDPGGEYDVCLTGNTQGSGTGPIAVKVIWTL